MAFDEALVSFDRTFRVPFFFRGLSNLKQLRCISTYLLLARHDVLGLFTWLKDHGSHADGSQGKNGADKNNTGSTSEIHGVWQGNEAIDSVKLSVRSFQ